MLTDNLHMLALHPACLRILKYLKEHGPDHSRSIEEATNLPRPNAGYYLGRLLQFGLLHSDYRIVRQATETDKGLAGKYYWVNEEKLTEVLKGAKQLINSLA